MTAASLRTCATGGGRNRISRSLRRGRWPTLCATGSRCGLLSTSPVREPGGRPALERPRGHAGSFRAFLRRILTPHALNLKRDAYRRTQRERSAAREETLPSAADMAAREELRRHVGEAVLSLPEPYRTTIWLRFRDELPPREVARAMQVPVETVRTRTKRALEQLRGKLEGRYGGPGGSGALLLPLASRRPLPFAGSAALLGGVLMKKTIVIAASGLLLLFTAAGTSLFLMAGDVASPEPEPMASGAMPAGSTVLGGEEAETTGRVRLEESGSRSTARRGLTGALFHSDGSPAVGVPYWSWGDERPEWTLLTDEPEFLGAVPPPLPDPDGSTDEGGLWSLPAGRSAVTFAPFEDIHLTYDLQEDPRSTALSLPAFSQIRIRLQDAGPEDVWQGLVFPAIWDENGEPQERWGVHVLRSMEVGIHNVALSLRMREFLPDGTQQAVYDAVRGLPYAWSACGAGFRLDREEEEVLAPATEELNLISRHPLVRLMVLEPDGEQSAVDGQLILWNLEKDLDSAWPRDIENGVSLMGWSALPTDTDFLAHVLLEDGEQHSIRFRIGAEEMRKDLRVYRGRGKPASLVLDLPENATLEWGSYNVYFEDAEGGLSRIEHHLSWGVVLASLSDPAVIEGVGSRLVFSNLPEGWRQLWVVTRSGRVARVDNPGSPAVSTGWMPDTELEEVPMAEVFEGVEGHYSVHLSVQLQGYSGRTEWVFVDSEYVGSNRTLADVAPVVWRKRVPLSLTYRATPGTLPGTSSSRGSEWGLRACSVLGCSIPRASSAVPSPAHLAR